MALVLRYAIRSHVGLIREGNEDSGYAGPRLLAIADGMGGAAAGELASAVVMATVARLDALPGGSTVSDAGGAGVLASSGEHQQMAPATEQTLAISPHDIAAHEAALSRGAADPGLGEPDLAVLGGAVVAANERLRAIVAERPELEGMGTTLTAMLWSGGRFGMVHVGDSRAYRLRDGLLEQMTADHTWVQRLIDEGRITEEEAGHHPQRSLLMRVLDGRTQVEADIGTFDAYAGDRYLLCSDGLSSFVSQETLAETLAAYPDPQQAVDALIELALRAGGPDNITCIVADTIDDGVLPGSSPNESTQMLGSVTPVVVGAASEGVDRLPRFTSAPPAPPAAAAPAAEEFPQNHPAGRAARLKPRRHPPQQAAPAPELHPGAAVATAPHYDPSAETRELDTVPGQRGAVPSGDAPHPGSSRRRAVGVPTEGEPPAKRGKKGLIVGAVVVVALGGAAAGAYVYSQGQYYVQTSSDGQVQLYNGITQLSFLASKIQAPALNLKQVPVSMRDELKQTQSFGSQSAANSYLDKYRVAAKTCSDYHKQQAQGGKQPTNQSSPQQLPAAAPTTSQSKDGAAIANGPGATQPSNNGGGGPVGQPPTSAETSSTLPAGTPASGSAPSSQASSGLTPSASTSSAGSPADPLAAFCAGTTDG